MQKIGSSKRLILISIAVILFVSCSKKAPPQPPFIEIVPRGPLSAKVTIYQFSNFACEQCRDAATVMKELSSEFPNDVKVYFKHLPFTRHPEVVRASKLALAAGVQGKFWEMHDALFEHQGSLGTMTYRRLARDLELDIEQLNRDSLNPEIDKILKADASHARSVRVNSLPTFVINGRVIRSYNSLETFRELANGILKSKK